jgi:Fic family protein
MRWNWTRLEWPNFTWDASRLADSEARFLSAGGVFLGAIRHVDNAAREQLTADALTVEAATTSEIEGEMLDRASVQSSIRRQLGLATDQRRIKPAEKGIADMMIDLHRSFAAPLSDDMLFVWHRMVTNGRRDLTDIGCYRRHEDAMHIVSGPFHKQKLHFEAPPSSAMPAEMAAFIAWFNQTAPGGPAPLPALTRAGIAHLYFVCIHPFEDGNGRIGRALAEKALAQGLGRPTLTALAATILVKRKAYYDVLEQANKGTELTDWLVWFAETAMEAQLRAIATVEFLIDKTRLLDRLRDQLNARQNKVLLRMLQEGPQGFEGGLSAANYLAITGAATATATRDLADMVAKGALLRTGERRYARYAVNIGARAA